MPTVVIIATTDSSLAEAWKQQLPLGQSSLRVGDTDIFSDMALIQELHQPQIGIVPIGDRFTMGGAVAALACRRYFKFEHILPSHYASFGMVDATADKFVEALEDQRDRAKVSKAGAVQSF